MFISIFTVLCHCQWWCRSNWTEVSPETVLQAPWQISCSVQHSSR